MPKVSVIIVTYNSSRYISKCLACVNRQDFEDFEVIVVDNASDDNTVETVKALCPEATLLELASNTGYSEAHQKALEHASGDFIGVLNPDAFPESNWLAEMVNVMTMDNRCGMVASAVLSDENPSKLESAGMGVVKSGLGRLLLNGDNYSDKLEVSEVFAPAGAAALFSKAMLVETGFFEPRLFMYYEELDLAFRARSLGWKCLLAPRARCHHMGGSPDRSGKLYYLQRNRLLTIARCWPVKLILKNLHAIILYDILSFMGAIFFEHNTGALRARLDFIKMLPGAIVRRVRTKQVLKSAEFEPWIMGTGGVMKEVRGFLEKYGP